MIDEFLDILKKRELLSETINMECPSEHSKGYVGYDLTGPSLHIGHLGSLMSLSWLEETGNKPVVVLGTGTSLVGDPSGKDKSRLLIESSELDRNKENIEKIFPKFLKKYEIYENRDWLEHRDYLLFLIDIGQYFSVNRMISMESVKSRLKREQHLSYLEFSYMILQAFDFYFLRKEEGVSFQMGGQDQIGNILMGIHLGQKLGYKDMAGIATPLLLKADGTKMGKSEEGAVWLDDTLLSPSDYWQYWRNIDDRDVVKFLKMFTKVKLSEIERFNEISGQELNDGKILLANEATSLLHGYLNDTPDVFVTKNNLEIGIPILDLISRTGRAVSGKEAKRLLNQGGIRINGEKVNKDKRVSLEDIKDERILLSRGKNRFSWIGVSEK